MHDTDAAVITPEHRELLGELLDRWSLHVIDELCEGPRCFNDLRRAVPDVSPKSLTTTLRRLERNGMVERAVLTTRPVAVEYRLTPLAHSVQTLIDALYRWTTTSLPAITAARTTFDAGDDAYPRRRGSPSCGTVRLRALVSHPGQAPQASTSWRTQH